MTTSVSTIGWDVGGAHLKFTQVDPAGALVHVRQVPCPLWRGIAQLDNAFALALSLTGEIPARHAVTMTGELSDIFADREQGVQLLSARVKQLLNDEVLFYAGQQGFLSIDEVANATEKVASANWLATGTFLAQRCPDCILVDIGSTTCDLLRIREGRVAPLGYTDSERLRTGELVYTGAVRTPLSAIAREVPFEGDWQAIVAERFAVTGDVYRLTGELTEAMLEHYVHFDAADGGGYELIACARRLARMLGCDFEQAPLEDWQRVASFLADAQADLICRGLWRLRTRDPATVELPLILAGAGRFLGWRVARRLGRQAQDLAAMIDGPAELRDYAAVCAPATALAYLLRE